MLGVLVLFVIPVAFFVSFDALLFRRPPPWFTAAAERAWRRLRPLPPVPCDPFDTLELQHRLAALTSEIQRLEGDRAVFAKAHRVRAAQGAYDALLGEACRLAGVERADVEVPGPRRRARDELELASRGWFW